MKKRIFKNWPILTLVILLMMSCKEEDIVPPDKPCYSLASHPDWPVTPYKTGYTIQFPADYWGGIAFFEGPIFRTLSPGHDVYLFDQFCGAVWCNEYGDTLADGDVDILIRKEYGKTSNITLDQKITFCHQDTIQGYLFYAQDTLNYGWLYWNVDGVLRHALHAFFTPQKAEEVTTILQSIRRE